MASEITMVSGLSVVKGNLNFSAPTESKQVDMAGNLAMRTVQTIGTTYEAIDFGDLASAGVMRFKNLDSTNFVEIGLEVAAAFYPLPKLLPGECFGPLRASTQSLFAKADTAPVNLEVMAIEA